MKGFWEWFEKQTGLPEGVWKDKNVERWRMMIVPFIMEYLIFTTKKDGKAEVLDLNQMIYNALESQIQIVEMKQEEKENGSD